MSTVMYGVGIPYDKTEPQFPNIIYTRDAVVAHSPSEDALRKEIKELILYISGRKEEVDTLSGLIDDIFARLVGML